MTTGSGNSAGGGWRTLAGFWVFLVVAAGAGAGWLQVVGPASPGHGASADGPALAAMQLPAPLRAGPAAQQPQPPESSHPAIAAPVSAGAPPTAAPLPGVPPEARPGSAPRPPGAAIIGPQEALLQPAPDFPGSRLPRIGKSADGVTILPMQVYAAGYDPHETRPRVALLVAGMGLSAANSGDAVNELPAGVSLAYSPYAVSPDLDQARTHGHELLVSIPMEPAGYPLEDEGPRALLAGASMDENRKNLEWSLSRFQGYAGATGALGQLRGERFAHATDQMAVVAAELTTRGLFYIDPRAGEAAPAGAGRTIDLLVDDPPLRPNIDANLGTLEQMAIDRGAALGLVSGPRPVTVERVAAWTARLAAHGVALVPVTALLSTPPPAAAPARLGAIR